LSSLLNGFHTSVKVALYRASLQLVSEPFYF